MPSTPPKPQPPASEAGSAPELEILAVAEFVETPDSGWDLPLVFPEDPPPERHPEIPPPAAETFPDEEAPTVKRPPLPESDVSVHERPTLPEIPNPSGD